MKTSKVTLRKKLLKNKKRQSLYLDYYPPILNPTTGKFSRREFLGMYILVKPKDEVEQVQNKNTLLRARMLCNKRQNQIFNNDYGFLASDIENKDFLEYFEKLAKKRGRSISNEAIWLIVLSYLKDFSSEIKMKDLTIRFVDEFREYLLVKRHFKTGKVISQNTACSYFSKFIYAIKSAFKDGLLKENIAPKVDRIKAEETKKEFLTKEEATRLKSTPCKCKIQKRACLFMIYTGLRVSDIQKLVWSNVEHSEETGHYIRFQHQKTRNQQTLPFNDEAYKLLSERGLPNELIFKGFKKDYRILKKWAEDARIQKNIGFHTFRHSFATLLLNSDVSVFTVKEMLGHKDLKTTMNYVNLLNDKKISAANAINL
ncbi:site-specific integrase [Aquimarina sp. U1-2]|uniref:tyrosine-type recombinase/integrase n=1 Tax=Aquimarina sp. U1-2 TaxID=2823141 RepID=UPI001AEC938A|nr:site-specific integrase [Aquimarina sp. U1-2]MBP2833821.1 site-specific integrase [Aquimarina sp. U1-2]